ncbi:MAG: FAD:protein FMN transferase [Pirellulales bacterium]|nr:FAD:protein FMN transferase [Pirellulales bacterium]
MVRETPDPLVRVSRRAMACRFEVCYPERRCKDCARAALKALDLVDSLESQLSYFRPTSVIAEINRSAADGPVEVEPWLFGLLVLAKKLHAETSGAYDVASAPLWEAWGFARRKGKIPDDDQLADALAKVGAERIELDAAGRTVRFPAPGMKINLGGIGKGYALDECCRLLLDSGMEDFLLHGGRSSVLARGFLERGADAAARRCWEVGVADPRRAEKRLGIVRLVDRALGTTSIQFQSFRHRGRRYGHVIDPRTGRPAEGVLSTTVTTPTAALADALSTAFHVMGPAASLDYCRVHPEIGMVMVCAGRDGGKAEIVAGGVDDIELSPN